MNTVTVNIALPKALLKSMDEVAKNESRSRSELLREAARMYIERKRRWEGIFAFWGNEAKRAGIAEGGVDSLVRNARR